MSFILRTISRTADGRDIVRSAPVDDNGLTIGRDASNGVHLPDLAVDPFHATLERQEGRVLAESVGGLGFGVDGKATTRAMLDPGTGAELRFGSHVLTLSEDDGAPVDHCCQRRLGRRGTRRAKTTRAFSLRGKVPGKRVSAWGFIAADPCGMPGLADHDLCQVERCGDAARGNLCR